MHLFVLLLISKVDEQGNYHGAEIFSHAIKSLVVVQIAAIMLIYVVYERSAG